MFPFDRLARAVDDWAAGGAGDRVLVQIGSGTYVPTHARWVRMMTPGEFNASVSDSEIVVAHLGMGSIITAMQARKPIILMPRKFELGEHTSDHQLHGTDWMRSLPGVWIADEVKELQRLLDEFVAGHLSGSVDAIQPDAPPQLVDRVRAFIRSKDSK